MSIELDTKARSWMSSDQAVRAHLCHKFCSYFNSAPQELAFPDLTTSGCMVLVHVLVYILATEPIHIPLKRLPQIFHANKQVVAQSRRHSNHPFVSTAGPTLYCFHCDCQFAPSQYLFICCWSSHSQSIAVVAEGELPGCPESGPRLKGAGAGSGNLTLPSGYA